MSQRANGAFDVGQGSRSSTPIHSPGGPRSSRGKGGRGMKYLFAGTGIIAAVAFAALTWGPLRQAPMPPSPSHEASIIEPTVSTPEPRSPDAQQMPSRAELGDQPTAAR